VSCLLPLSLAFRLPRSFLHRRRIDSKFVLVRFHSAIIAVVLVLACVPLQVRAQGVSLDPATLRRIGIVAERFASYNIEMVEVTGGNCWKPYHRQSAAAAQATEPAQSASTPSGMNPNMYQYRPPIDLANPVCVSSRQRLALPTCE
jgi:hypothetical protein